MEFEQVGLLLRCRFHGDLNEKACERIAPRLKERIASASADDPQIEVEFDMKDVRLATSAFLRLCVVHCKELGRRRFRVTRLDGNVKQIFEFSGLLDIMTYTTTDDP